VGGPHAGAMFTLAESASGAVVLGAFGDQLDRAVPLPVRAEISFLKIAKGDITATAELDRPRAEVLAELDAGRRPEFPVEVSIRRGDGAETGRMTIVWTLRPNS
jgi:acyl-coenzyme A thioesterase PaaI-like protein